MTDSNALRQAAAPEASPSWRSLPHSGGAVAVPPRTMALTELREMLLRCEIERATRLCTRLLDSAQASSLTSLSAEWITPALRLLDQVTVAASEATMACMAAVAVVAKLRSAVPASVKPSARGRPSALLALVPGNTHTVGRQMVAEHLAAEGWSVSQLRLGYGTPELVEAMESMRPDLLGLSISTDAQVRELPQLIAGVLPLLDGRKRLVIGGSRAAAARYVQCLSPRIEVVDGLGELSLSGSRAS